MIKNNKTVISVLLLSILIICAFLVFAACPNGSSDNQDESEGEVTFMTITIGNKQFAATLYDTEAAQAFANMLPMTLDMSELNGNEKYNYLATSLPTKSERVGNITAGDVMLYGNNCIVLFYKSFSTPFSYTKIGKINDVSGLQQAVGSGNVTVTFQI